MRNEDSDYFLQNHQATKSANEFDVLLKRRTQKQRNCWRSAALPVLETTFRPRSQASAVLSHSQQTSSGENVLHASDLLLLRMSYAETNLFTIRKRGRFTIEFVLSDGRREKQIFLLVLDGKGHDVLIAPTRSGEPEFLQLFAAQPTCTSPVRIYKIIVNWQPLDFLSATPAWVSVTGVSKPR